MSQIMINDKVTLVEPLVTNLPHLGGCYKVLELEKVKDIQMVKVQQEGGETVMRIPLDCVIKVNE